MDPSKGRPKRVEHSEAKIEASSLAYHLCPRVDRYSTSNCPPKSDNLRDGFTPPQQLGSAKARIRVKTREGEVKG